MTAELTKVTKAWIIIISHEDGTMNDYRFTTKAQALQWAKAAGIKF